MYLSTNSGDSPAIRLAGLIGIRKPGRVVKDPDGGSPYYFRAQPISELREKFEEAGLHVLRLEGRHLLIQYFPWKIARKFLTTVNSLWNRSVHSPSLSFLTVVLAEKPERT